MSDLAWVTPLKGEALEPITPETDGWFAHAKAQLFLAYQDERVVGRISAHIDTLGLTMPANQGFGPGVGQWGLLEAEHEEVFTALLSYGEDWLHGQDMKHALGPITMSIWEEPGLLIQGYDHPPTIMMGHASPDYRAWIERAGYVGVKQLLTYQLDIRPEFPKIIQRIVKSVRPTRASASAFAKSTIVSSRRRLRSFSRSLITPDRTHGDSFR